MTKRHIKIYEIGDPENCPGCRQMKRFLTDLSKRYDVSFSLIPFSFVHKNSEKSLQRIRKLYGKEILSIPVVIIVKEDNQRVFFDNFEEIERDIVGGG